MRGVGSRMQQLIVIGRRGEIVMHGRSPCAPCSLCKWLPSHCSLAIRCLHNYSNAKESDLLHCNPRAAPWLPLAARRSKTTKNEEAANDDRSSHTSTSRPPSALSHSARTHPPIPLLQHSTRSMQLRTMVRENEEICNGNRERIETTTTTGTEQ